MKKITIAIAGLGSRGFDTYGKRLAQMGDTAQVVAVAEPRQKRRDEAAALFGLSESGCFETAEEMLKQERLADVMLICTLDDQHEHQAVAALEAGYHLLLEKPIAPTKEGCRHIEETAEKYNRHVAVCHVLRFTPFYQKIRELIVSGKIGDVVNVQAMEHVGYWHQAHSFVRGNWRNSEQTSPMILQKCCHDMDILLWLTGKRCVRVTSFGSLRLFKESCAPEGSTLRCMDSCAVKDTCPFNAVKWYGDQLKKGNTDWPLNVVCPYGTPDEENLLAALKEGPYGRCVYHCDNNVVDHQVVNLLMEDGATVNFTMCAFSEKCYRTLEISGTAGEIKADMNTNIIHVQPFGQAETVIDVTALADDFSGHGGGDVRMLRDFIGFLQNEDCRADTLTSIQRSMESHYIAFAAEKSRRHDGMSVSLDEH